MTPIQELQFHLENGDLADAYVEKRETSYVGHFQYIRKDRTRFDPSATLPQIAAGLSFEVLLHTINNLAVGLKTVITSIDNINNDELISVSAQRRTVTKMGLSTQVLINGKP